jgi:hypothetical protein
MSSKKSPKSKSFIKSAKDKVKAKNNGLKAKAIGGGGSRYLHRTDSKDQKCSQQAFLD